MFVAVYPEADILFLIRVVIVCINCYNHFAVCIVDVIHMIRVAIVEDEARDRKRLRECLDFLTESEGISFDVTEFSSGTSFIGNYLPKYDIVFMDIEMPDMSGMEAARAMREMDPSVILIFVTNMAQYAIAGYEVEALDFILKPVNRYSFAIKVKRAVARTIKQSDECIHVKAEGTTYLIRIADIHYLEMVSHHVVYHTADKNYSEYITLKEAVRKIDREYFVHCNRGYLVNLRYVKAVNGNVATVGADNLIISRPQKKAFLTALSEFMRGKK